MIAIRTSFSKEIGIGHFVRMSYLAKALADLNEQVIFLLDIEDERIKTYIQDFEILYIYIQKQEKINEVVDADLSINLLKKFNIRIVIVDSYLLNINWEKRIKSSGYVLIVFDDLGSRKHFCDYLFDQKWAGLSNTFKRYNGLISDGCKVFLGPKFAILNPKYTKKGKKETSTFNIMFSLGGGGDLSLLADIIEKLITLTNDKNLCFLPIIGPLSFNEEMIVKLASKDKRVQPIKNCISLYDYYIQTSLFVGALGTSLYELSALGIPALTFSLTPNQENNIFDLEDLGHYFHISFEEFKCTNQLAELILVLKNNINRIIKLRSHPTIKIDGYGVKRVAKVISSKLKLFNLDEIISYNLNYKKFTYTNLSSDVTIRKVDDSDINHYLYSRNLEKNMKNMIVNKPISRLEHYKWWFSNKRESYILEKESIKKLYIWHQLGLYDEKEYLIGGWFVCDNETSFDIVIAALQWQLNMTAYLYPHAVWIAIIKKTNDFVNLLNKYMGFIKVEKDEKEYQAIKYFFNSPSYNEFNFIKFQTKE